jgi:hypothetical protein
MLNNDKQIWDDRPEGKIHGSISWPLRLGNQFAPVEIVGAETSTRRGRFFLGVFNALVIEVGVGSFIWLAIYVT